MLVRAIVALLGSTPLLAAATGTGIASIATVGAAESVFDWQTQHCATGRPLAPCHPAPCRATPYRRDVPDAPAMAWRDPVSNLTYVAPGDSRGTWPSIGRGLDAVQHDCSSMIFNYSGPTGYLQPASMFSSHEWLYAPWVVPPASPGANATLYMLVHNEFHGWEHAPALCNATSMVHGRCWYNSVSLSVSRDGGRTIEHVAPPPQHLVAAAATPYVPNHGAFGVFSPSQIVPYQGWLYSFPRFSTQAEPQGEGRGSGITVMRIQEKDLHDPGKWRFWTGGDGSSSSFSGQFADPYTQQQGGGATTTPSALAFGPPPNASQPKPPAPSQAVPRYLPAQGLFLMTGYANMPSGHGPGGHFGFATAAQPWGPWSAMRPITGVDVNPTKDAGDCRGLYPSLLDPESTGLSYETIVGDTAYGGL